MDRESGLRKLVFFFFGGGSSSSSSGAHYATIQDTADLAELAYGRLKVSDSLRWDTLYALEFLSGLL